MWAGTEGKERNTQWKHSGKCSQYLLVKAVVQWCHQSSGASWAEPWKMSKVQKKEEGRKFISDWTWVLKHFIQWGVMLKEEKILFCFPQRIESRPGRGSHRERGFRPQGGGTDSRGWPPAGGALQTQGRESPSGPACLLAWAPQTAWFRHRTGSRSIQLPSNSGILCIFDASAKQALYNIARKEKNYCSPVTAFLTWRPLPDSLSRLCWLGPLSVLDPGNVKNISFTCRPMRTPRIWFYYQKS